ncbi:MlaD family protein [Coleofasciculus sp. F4-SAH-05]|jgi:phospholipid/cholesterol/gamma-HCH transport system substrate-binding protein|uniref:MlaD family protein n=1 Tax=Coleofasciculus sp. F4-SAH-05 TaxID=3069525 RepID=UPI0033046CFE
MRSRTIREGSVGLLILVGLAVLAGLAIWIRGLKFGDRSYSFVVNFPNVAGMKEGATVRYRGVDVGNITDIQATTNGVDVTIEIASEDLVIPEDVAIEANQSGLIGETSVDITPLREVSSNIQSMNPLKSECNSDVIICSGEQIEGEIGVSFIELLRNTDRLTTIYTDPLFFNNINSLAQNASLAASGIAQLAGELSLLSRSVRQEVGGFSQASDAITTAATQTTQRIGDTADQFSQTAVQLNRLIASTNDLVTRNRAVLVGTLTSVSQTSEQLGVLLSDLRPTLENVNTTIDLVNAQVDQADVSTIIENVETASENLVALSANAAELSADLRDISNSLDSPSTAIVLQQLLDSARVTFENTQKITSDLEDLTGDPAFRQNLKELVNGLSELVSSTEQLEQQIEVAQVVESASAEITTAAVQVVDKSRELNPQSIDEELTKSKHRLNHHHHILKKLPPIPKKSTTDSDSQ